MKQQQVITPDSLRMEIAAEIRHLGAKYGSWQVFTDFVEMSSLAVSNLVDLVQYEVREKHYLELMSRYTHDEIQVFPILLANLTTAISICADMPEDILGPLFHELELHNKWHGQFFSPQPICDFMGEIVAFDANPKEQQKDYVAFCEPASGSGAMVLGTAKALKNRGYSLENSMVVEATDVDLKCVCMTYLQLSLYGIPAVVIHGNSLTQEKWSRWYTPAFIAGNWWDKLYNA